MPVKNAVTPAEQSVFELHVFLHVEENERAEFFPLESSGGVAAEFVRIYIRLGENEQAFAWLAKAVQERNRLAWELKIDPQFDPLRSDPRFEALVQRVVAENK